MECVDHIVEAEYRSGVTEFIFRDPTCVVEAAGVKELASLECSLAVDLSDVFTDVPGEWNRQLLDLDEIVSDLRQFKKRFRQCEFVRSHIASKKDNASPVLTFAL